MANVIPSDIRHDMRRDARARFVLIGSVIALCAAMVTFAIFLPAYLILSREALADSVLGTPISSAQRAEDQLSIKRIGGLVHALAPLVSASSSATDAIAAVVAARPAEVYLDQVIYMPGRPGSLILNGSTYPDNDSDTEINDYRTALSSVPLFSSVTVPVGALVGTDGGRFNITILGTF